MVGTAVLRIVVSNDSMKKPIAISHGSRRLPVLVSAGASGTRERCIDDDLRFRK